MDEKLNFSILVQDGNEPKMSRLSHQLPQSLPDRSTSSDNLNPQLPSLEDSELEWQTFDEFNEKLIRDRVRELHNLIKFDVDDAACHAARINDDDQDPMLDGELRVRLKDFRRLHRDICATFQELMELKFACEDQRLVSKLFQHHVSTYKSASARYERKIEEARNAKVNFRIDFRNNFSGKLASKFTRTLCSGDIAYFPASLERPAPLSQATPLMPLTPPPLLNDMNNSLISESIESTIKPSISPQIMSPSAATLQLAPLIVNVLPAEVPSLSPHVCQVGNSLKLGLNLLNESFSSKLESSSRTNRSMSLTTSAARPVMSSGSTRMPAISSPMPIQADAPTQPVFKPVIIAKVQGSSRMPVNSSSVLTSASALPRIRQGSANAGTTVARFRTPSSDHDAIASPAAARIHMMPFSSVQRPANKSSQAALFHLHTPLYSPLFSMLMTSEAQDIQTGMYASIRFSFPPLRYFESSTPASSSRVLTTSEVPTPTVSQLVTFAKVRKISSSSLKFYEVSLMPINQSPAPISFSASPHVRQGSANASTSVARFRTPLSNHFAIASPAAARIQMMSTSLLQRPANDSPQASSFHLHTLLFSTFESLDFDEKINEFFQVENFYVMKKTTSLEHRFCSEACKEISHQDKAGEIITHLPVTETICILESNCNAACEFIQDKKSLKIPPITITEDILDIEQFKLLADAFNDFSHAFESIVYAPPLLIAMNFLIFNFCDSQERFSELFRAKESFCYVDEISFLSNALTLVDPATATATMKFCTRIKRKLKKKEKLARFVKFFEDSGKKLILKLSISSRSVQRNCVSWTNLSYLMGLASGWPAMMPKDDFQEIVQKINKTFFGFYHFVLPPEISRGFHLEPNDRLVLTQHRTNNHITRFQQNFNELKMSTNNIEKSQLVRFPVANGICLHQHVDDILLKFLSAQVAFFSDKHILCADARPEALPVSRELTTTSKVPADLEALALRKPSRIDFSLQHQGETSIQIVRTAVTARMCSRSPSWNSRTC